VKLQQLDHEGKIVQGPVCEVCGVKQNPGWKVKINGQRIVVCTDCRRAIESGLAS